jgi:hypothetical protein
MINNWLQPPPLRRKTKKCHTSVKFVTCTVVFGANCFEELNACQWISLTDNMGGGSYMNCLLVVLKVPFLSPCIHCVGDSYSVTTICVDSHLGNTISKDLYSFIAHSSMFNLTASYYCNSYVIDVKYMIVCDNITKVHVADFSS